MARILQATFTALMIAPALVLGASLENYQSRLEIALNSLRQAGPREHEAALDRMVDLLPPEEDVIVGDHKLRVNNVWIYEIVTAYAEERDQEERQRIYGEARERLAALLEHVSVARHSLRQGSERERQQLAQILSGREFQRHSTKSWMSRLRRWAADALAQLFRLLPHWRRGEGSLTRLLEILVWIFGLVVIILAVNRVVRRSHRGQRTKTTKQEIMLGAILQSQTTPVELRAEAVNLAQQREFRGAIRYLYISMLFALQRQGLVRLDIGSTNGDYLRRLRPSGTIYPRMLYLTRRFEQFWYGKGSPSEVDYQEFLDHYQTALGTLTSQ